jgi:hypothetical protein
MFRSVGRGVGRHPVRVILAWAALIVGIAGIAAVVVGAVLVIGSRRRRRGVRGRSFSP